MELLILAAGRGSRLGEITKNMPKGLIKINGKSLIERQIEIVNNELNIDNIYIAVGYKSEKFSFLKNIKRLNIPNWHKFNMLGTFLSAIALNEIDTSKDLLITYGDIFLKDGFFSRIKFQNKKNILLPIISDWKKQWQGRYKNPLLDLETLSYNKLKILTDIGRKPKSFDEIMGQFTGTIFVPNTELKLFCKSSTKFFESNNNADMTSLLSYLITKNIDIQITEVPNSTWYEIDTVKDLEYAIKNENIK